MFNPLMGFMNFSCAFTSECMASITDIKYTTIIVLLSGNLLIYYLYVLLYGGIYGYNIAGGSG